MVLCGRREATQYVSPWYVVVLVLVLVLVVVVGGGVVDLRRCFVFTRIDYLVLIWPLLRCSGRFSEEICEFRFHIEELVVKSLLQFAAVDVIRAAILRNEALRKASPTDRDMFFQSILRLVRTYSTSTG